MSTIREKVDIFCFNIRKATHSYPAKIVLSNEAFEQYISELPPELRYKRLEENKDNVLCPVGFQTVITYEDKC